MLPDRERGELGMVAGGIITYERGYSGRGEEVVEGESPSIIVDLREDGH